MSSVSQVLKAVVSVVGIVGFLQPSMGWTMSACSASQLLC